MRYAIITSCLVLIIIIFIILKSTSFPAKIRKAEEYIEGGFISKANDIIKKILERKKRLRAGAIPSGPHFNEAESVSAGNIRI